MAYTEIVTANATFFIRTENLESFCMDLTHPSVLTKLMQHSEIAVAKGEIVKCRMGAEEMLLKYVTVNADKYIAIRDKTLNAVYVIKRADVPAVVQEAYDTVPANEEHGVSTIYEQYAVAWVYENKISVISLEAEDIVRNYLQQTGQ